MSLNKSMDCNGLTLFCSVFSVEKGQVIKKFRKVLNKTRVIIGRKNISLHFSEYKMSDTGTFTTHFQGYKIFEY